MDELLHVLGKHIGHRAYFVVLSVSSVHARDVLEHVVLPSQVVGRREMIHLLIAIHLL